MLDTPSPNNNSPVVRARALHERAWNSLVPRCALDLTMLPNGVRYMHPTKGYRWISKKRFAIRGVY
jgi:hypothetical protein